jgi:tyrosine-protein phosphatase YwqE
VSESPDGLGDFHNHLVPAVDDGSATLDDALDGIQRMVAIGFSRIITTPHFDASLLKREPARAEEFLSRVGEGWQTVAAAARARFPDLDFRRGQEVRLDVPDCDFRDERLRLGGTSFVLVEWPRFIPPETAAVLSRFRAQGFRPIVAHPERYQGAQRELALLAEWKNAGAYLQMNYGSLVGRYGSEVRAAAFTLLREGLIDYLCTDFHGRPQLRLYTEEAIQKLEEVGASEQLLTLGSTNPQRKFMDEAPLPAPRLPSERGFWGKVRELFH